MKKKRLSSILFIILWSVLLQYSVSYTSYFKTCEVEITVTKTYPPDQNLNMGNRTYMPLQIHIPKDNGCVMHYQKNQVILLNVPKESVSEVKKDSVILVRYHYGDFDPPPDAKEISSFEEWTFIRFIKTNK